MEEDSSMNKVNGFVAVIVVLFFIGNAVGMEDETRISFMMARAMSGSLLNAVYIIEGKEVRLVDGHHEEQAAPGSVIKVKTSVFGKPVYGDLDGDGDEDAALFLVQDPGGSGIFYYVAAALKAGDGYSGTNVVLMGDRIAPQTLKIQDGVIIANYNERRPDEPMAAPPSVGKTKYLAVRNGRLEKMKK
jgi:hypothetical protein